MKHLRWFAIPAVLGIGGWVLYLIVQLVPNQDKAPVASWGLFLISALSFFAGVGIVITNGER